MIYQYIETYTNPHIDFQLLKRAHSGTTKTHFYSGNIIILYSSPSAFDFLYLDFLIFLELERIFSSFSSSSEDTYSLSSSEEVSTSTFFADFLSFFWTSTLALAFVFSLASSFATLASSSL